MRIEENYSLEKHNTFHLPVKARWFMEYTNEEELGRIFRDEYFQECLSLHIGSGNSDPTGPLTSPDGHGIIQYILSVNIIDIRCP